MIKRIIILICRYIPLKIILFNTIMYSRGLVVEAKNSIVSTRGLMFKCNSIPI